MRAANLRHYLGSSSKNTAVAASGTVSDAFGRGLVAKTQHAPPPERCLFMSNPLLAAASDASRMLADACERSARILRQLPNPQTPNI